MTRFDDDWNPEERARLAALPRTQEPPRRLEERVLAALRAQGVVRPGRRRAWRLPVAASLAAFACGAWLGRVSTTPSPSPGQDTAGVRRFVLFLHPGNDDGAGGEGRVQEYRNWARGLAAQGRLESGEKLKALERVLQAAPGAGGPEPWSGRGVQGYFLIRARSLDEAEALARTSPHLRHGGTIVLREVDPT